MALTTDELQQVRYYLGYHVVGYGALPYTENWESLFAVMRDNLSSWGETQIRDVILPKLAQVDADTYSQRSRRKASEVGSIKLNENELGDLLDLREHWVCQLETATGIARNKRRSGASVEVY